MAREGKKTVLVVDDEPLVLEMCTNTLRDAGYAVLTARNGWVALEQVSRQPVDAVLLDIIMPDTEGIETLLHLKRTRPELPIYVMSGGSKTGHYDVFEIAREFGASGILKKPFGPSALLALLDAGHANCDAFCVGS